MTDLFNTTAVLELQEFISEQSDRKARLGKSGYASRKFWEEISELRDEITDSKELGTLTDNFINELGDVIFCVLGDTNLAEQLKQRLEFDVRRAEIFKELDEMKISKPELKTSLDALKLTPTGWVSKSGQKIDRALLDMLPKR